jgi:uncharacterized protein (DUF2147 family)
MHRLIRAAACLGFVAASAGATAAPQAAAILGDWMTPGGLAKVRIASCGDHPTRLCGAVVWLRTPHDDDGRPRRDSANPDPDLRGRPVIGMAMAADLKMTGVGRWGDGTIYNPSTGKTYRSSLSVSPEALGWKDVSWSSAKARRGPGIGDPRAG